MRKVLLAVQFDDRLEALLQAGEALSRATGAALRLVHVCDPWTRSFLATAVEAGPPELVQALKAEAVRVATRRLTQLAASMPREPRCEAAVLTGDIVRSLASDAEANDCGMIVMGARRGGAAGTSLGISTAVGVIMDASCPVMVLNEEARLAPRGGLRVLVADDFTDDHADALAVGFELARAWRGGELFQVHVEGQADLQEARRGGVTPETIEFLHRQAEERMRARAGDGPRRLEAAGGRFHLEIVLGSVADELERSAVAARADVAVFGRHRVFHRETMHVGQVPFKAMLAQARPVVVVPTR